MSEVVIIAGSPTAHSRTAALLKYIRRALCQRDLNVSSMSVLDFDAADLLYARFDSPAIQRACQLIAGARAVIIGTPVYKASYTGALKTFLDLLPQYALKGKAVLPIMSGAAPGHQLALDYALKPLLTVLGAQDILQGVYVLDKQILQFGADIELNVVPDVQDRLLRSIEDVASIFPAYQYIPALAGPRHARLVQASNVV